MILRRDAEDLGQQEQKQKQRILAYERTGNVQLAKLLGADVRVLDCEEKAPGAPSEEFRDLSGKLGIADDGSAFFIPQGASESPSGGVGYARWIFEMLEQEARLRDDETLRGSRIFDNVVVACATGGTLAGMVAGLRLAERSGWVKHGHRRKIIGIETFAQDLATRKQVVLQIARDTAELLGLQRQEIKPEDVNLDGRWTAGGYGVYDEQTKATIQTAARTEALLLDPVYTGKAMTAVKHGILHGDLQGNTLFVHTGGHVVLPAYLGIEET